MKPNSSLFPGNWTSKFHFLTFALVLELLELSKLESPGVNQLWILRILKINFTEKFLLKLSRTRWSEFTLLEIFVKKLSLYKNPDNNWIFFKTRILTRIFSENDANLGGTRWKSPFLNILSQWETDSQIPELKIWPEEFRL